MENNKIFTFGMHVLFSPIHSNVFVRRKKNRNGFAHSSHVSVCVCVCAYVCVCVLLIFFPRLFCCNHSYIVLAGIHYTLYPIHPYIFGVYFILFHFISIFCWFCCCRESLCCAVLLLAFCECYFRFDRRDRVSNISWHSALFMRWILHVLYPRAVLLIHTFWFVENEYNKKKKKRDDKDENEKCMKKQSLFRTNKMMIVIVKSVASHRSEVIWLSLTREHAVEFRFFSLWLIIWWGILFSINLIVNGEWILLLDLICSGSIWRHSCRSNLARFINLGKFFVGNKIRLR